VEFYDGKDGIRAIFRTFGLAKKAKFISSYSLLFKEFPEDIEHWIRSAQKQRTRVQIRQLVSNEPEGRRFAGEVLSSPAWNIRILPKEFGVKIDFGIVDERIVALASFDPVFIVLVHSESIADFFSSFFELIWKNSKKIRKKK
jgi:hypothetical protein